VKLDRIFEQAGTRYFEFLKAKVQDKHYIHIDGLPSDSVLEVVARSTTTNATIIALLIGAITTVPAVFFEMRYGGDLEGLAYYLPFALITLGMLIVELGVLYWLSLHAVYTLANILGYTRLEFDPSVPDEYQIVKLLVRTAMEIPDPNIDYLGIDLQQNIPHRKILLLGVLYKAKVMLSSVILKFILRKILARVEVRTSLAWISIPVTAIWDGVVMARIIKDAKLRLFGYQLAQYIG
jgi:hypothetical protein